MTPKYSELVFKQNATRPDIYDLTGTRFKEFTFLRLSKPRTEFLRRQGAEYVIESWKRGQKNLFTGLIPFGEGYYYGDRREGGKRVLIVVKLNSPELTVYLFKSYPRQLRPLFTEFIKRKAPGNHPQEPMSPTGPATGPVNDTNIQFSSTSYHD